MATDTPNIQRRPLVVEIVGPAGAGKTTLLLALRQREEKIQAVFHLRRLRFMPFLVSNAFLLLPTILRQYRDRKRFTWREIRMMVRLKAMHHVLGRPVSNNGAVTIVDQGPVYTLARLHEFGFERSKSQSLGGWWDNSLNQWATTLDAIIWLDAPDAILVERIYARDKWHSVKRQSEHEAYTFLARFRTSYGQVIAQLAASGGPKVLCFNTGQEALDQIAGQVLAAFHPEHREH
jgi:thymidylate kinase